MAKKSVVYLTNFGETGFCFSEIKTAGKITDERLTEVLMKDKYKSLETNFRQDWTKYKVVINSIKQWDEITEKSKQLTAPEAGIWKYMVMNNTKQGVNKRKYEDKI